MAKRISRWLLPPFTLLAALLIYRLAVGAIDASAPSVVPAVPWTITPPHDEPLVASDEELLRILQRLVPPAGVVKTNNFVHALRLWGVSPRFEESAVVDGAELRDYFLNDQVFRKWNGQRTPPLFILTDTGLYARAYDDSLQHRASSSFHANDLLATFAEVGTPLDSPMKLRDGTSSVRALAETSLRDFHLGQHEFEWTVISYARYYFPQKRFKNKYGEMISADDLVQLCIDRPLGLGPCNGLHRLEALVVMYRADEQARVLSPQTRRKLLQHLAEVSAKLQQSQHEAGYWTREWPTGSPEKNDAKASIYDQLLVTGHHLEWLALAPEEVQPPRESIVRAARWTAKTMLEIDNENLVQHYGPFTHAARALCLWRGREPGQVWQAAMFQPSPAQP